MMFQAQSLGVLQKEVAQFPVGLPQGLNMIGLPLYLLATLLPAHRTYLLVSFAQGSTQKPWLGGHKIDGAALWMPEASLVGLTVFCENG